MVVPPYWKEIGMKQGTSSLHRNTSRSNRCSTRYSSFSAPARQRSISLTCHAPQAMPCVIGERDRLPRVLSNLVGNAVKFTPPCGRISVHVRLLEEGPRRDLARAADREGDRASTRGSDLAESVPGRGTTFHFTVPCAPPS